MSADTTPDSETLSLADLTDQHVGREVHVYDLSKTNGVQPVWLLRIRVVERDGEHSVELHDGLRRPGSVTLFRYPSTTQCRVSRPFPQQRRRKRR